MKAALGALITVSLLGAPPAFASVARASAQRPVHAVVAQANPSPSPASGTPTASPSAGDDVDEGGISTGAGIVIAAILIGGLLLMRSRLLRR